MHVGHALISTRGGPRRVLVVAPKRDHVIEPDSLGEWKRGDRTARFHRSLVRLVEQDPAPISAVVIRSQGTEDSGQFRLDRSLDESALEEVGYALVRDVLSGWRELLEQSVLVVARVELRVWELAALRTGTARLMAELDALAVADNLDRAAAARRDRWLLERALLNFGVGLQTALHELLPSRIEQLEASRLQASAGSMASFPL